MSVFMPDFLGGVNSFLVAFLWSQKFMISVLEFLGARFFLSAGFPEIHPFLGAGATD